MLVTQEIIYFITQASSKAVFADLTSSSITGFLGTWKKQSEWPSQTEILKCNITSIHTFILFSTTSILMYKTVQKLGTDSVLI